MDHIDFTEILLAPDLVAELEAMAAIEQRSSREIVREAVELYLQDRRPAAEARTALTPREAAARMLELRKGNVRLDDSALRDLMTYGRA